MCSLKWNCEPRIYSASDVCTCIKNLVSSARFREKSPRERAASWNRLELTTGILRITRNGRKCTLPCAVSSNWSVFPYQSRSSFPSRSFQWWSRSRWRWCYWKSNLQFIISRNTIEVDCSPAFSQREIPRPWFSIVGDVALIHWNCSNTSPKFPRTRVVQRFLPQKYGPIWKQASSQGTPMKMPITRGVKKVEAWKYISYFWRSTYSTFNGNVMQINRLIEMEKWE